MPSLRSSALAALLCSGLACRGSGAAWDAPASITHAPAAAPPSLSETAAPTASAEVPAPPAGSARRSSGERSAVLFSGHSLLDNPMPDWVEHIAESRGQSLGWEQQIVLGSPIRVRTKGDDPEAADWPGYTLGKGKSGGGIDVLRELSRPSQLRPGEKYQRLLITERSDLLGAMMWEDTTGFLRHYHDRVVENGGPGSGTLLYQCWPAIDRAAPQVWLKYVRQELFGWECVAAKVNETLRSEGRQDRVAVVPGGVALAALVERALAGGVPGVSGSAPERLDAIFSDDAHLTPLGTYLLAAVHYTAIFGQSPVGARGPAEVPAAALPVLQHIAGDTVSDYRSRARQPSLDECRERFANQLCPAYQRFRGREDKVQECGAWASKDSAL